jgi:hypothetical protein
VDSTAHQRLDGGSTPPSQQAEPLPSRLGSGEAASDAEPSSDQPFQASFEAAPQLRSRKPLTSWAELESSSVVESPADDLFGLEPAEKRPPRAPFKSALGAAFAAFGEPEPALDAEGSVTPADPNKPTYDEPIGPPTRPHDMPRRDRSDSTTIAGLLAEALAAYQSSTEGDDDEDDDDEEQRQAPEPLDRFDSFLNDSRQSGFSGRHRSPE